MADDAPATPKREPVPLAMRLAFTPVVLAMLLLICIRVLNAGSLYPGVISDPETGPQVAKTRSDVREITFESSDGTKLYGWVQGSDAAPRKIIQFMGNGEFVGPSAELYADSCKALNAQFLLFDYRGYANSEGRPSELGFYEDARAAYEFAANDLGWQASRIIVWGRSLGGGPATKLVSELTEQKRAPQALILEAPFTSIPEMASVAMPHLGKPEWLVYELYDNLARAPQLKLPVFHFQGTSDEIIPYAQGEKLMGALPGPKQHLKLQDVGHNNIWQDETRAAMIRTRINDFLKAHE